MTSESERWHAGSSDLSGDLEALRVPGRESEAIDAATRAENTAVAADDADGQASAAPALALALAGPGSAAARNERHIEPCRPSGAPTGGDLYRAIRNRLRSEDLV
jgi:hypothetical protein